MKPRSTATTAQTDRGATDLEDRLVRNAVHALRHGYSTTSDLGLPDNLDDLDAASTTDDVRPQPAANGEA